MHPAFNVKFTIYLYHMMPGKLVESKLS